MTGEVSAANTNFPYYTVKSIHEQVVELNQHFPGLGFANHEVAEQPLPVEAEAWFAIPRWQTIANT